ncbi:MAG: hypothetical protein C0502_02065 [Opitutus sp.]|nr:hypothetical protein [Opitutus sp.]
MKRSTEILVLAAVLTAAFATADLTAQPAGRPDRPPRGERREAIGEKMAEYLGLTDAQKTQLKQIHRAHRDAMEKLQDDESLTRKQFREQMAALQKSFQEQRRAVLTPEQQQKADEHRARMQELRKERRERRGHGPDDDDGPPPPPKRG